MKKKISISSGNTRILDYQQWTNKLENLKAKFDECQRRMDYVGAARVKGEMVNAIKMLEYLETQQQITLGDLVRNMDEKEQIKYSAMCVSIILLADLLDSVSTDLQSMMGKIGAPEHLNVMHAVKDIKANSAAFVRMFDGASDDAVSSRFAELGDSVLNYIQLRSRTFAKNERRKNHLML